MVPYLRAANVKDGELDLTDVKEMNFTPDEQRVFSLRPGDVLVTEGSGSLRSVGASSVWLGEIDHPVCFQNTLLRLRPRPATDPRFLAWWCRYAFADGIFASVATGANIFHVSAERVRSLPMTYIDLRRQHVIADYLDTETDRIDALIAKKRRMIELLDERHGVVIRRTLETAGDSIPLKRRWTVTDCKHRTPTYVTTGYPVASPGDIAPGRIDLSDARRFVDETDYEDLADDLRRPRRGDIIYSRNASIGIAAYVDTDQKFCMGQDVCRISSRDQDQLFLTYVLNTLGVDQLAVQKVGSTFSRVNVAQILELLVPAPPPSVQTATARELDYLQSRHDRAVGLLDGQIDLLVEHRQALITAAVTGELAIPGVAA
jgi:type I restriction enzyme S subunit